MLDVHAPEHTIHGVRDFLIHLLTITVGLLIALGLENLAEWRHHVHLRHEAATNMRHEIEANRKDLQGVTEAIPREQQQMQAVMRFLNAKRLGQKVEIQPMHIGVVQATLQDASWSTASATGTLSYMPFDEVQRFASAYALQRKFSGLQDQALPAIVGTLAVMGTTRPEDIRPEDADEALRNVRLTMGNLETVRGMAHDLDGLYEQALKQE